MRLEPLKPSTIRFLLDVDPAAHLGRRVGPYELTEVLGEGGMGTVYLATRREGGFDQRVALKLVGQAHDGLVERLREERQILAGLAHPNIARLLDGGASDLGPYLAMEYVEGRPIDTHARDLPRAQRLELLRTVCAAVQFSHQNLVVHCDLKPSNILVTAAGEVKLLDFGVARVLDATTGVGPGNRRMTRRFASPEQLRGDPVTTASDVFALGRVLQEITGDSVPPALEAIARKATAEDPHQRYPTAAEFSDDLGRFLGARPVRARPGSPAHRTGLFFRRNKWPVAAAALVLLTLAGGLIATRRQARIAEARLEQVRTLAGAMVSDLHDGIRDLPGATIARRMLVESALRYLDELDRSGRPEVRLELAHAYEQVAEIQGNPHYTNLGDLAGATASYARALELREEAWTEDSLSASVRHALGRSLGFTAVVTSWNEDNPGAIAQAERALRLLDPLPEAAHDAARVRAELGWYRIWEGEAERGLEDLDTATRALSRLASAEPENTEVRLDLWRAFSYAVDGLRFTGRETEALALVEGRGLPLLEGMLARNASLARLQYGLHVAYDYVGQLNVALGRTEAAVEAYARSEAHARVLVDTDPANQKAHEALARAEMARAGVLAGLGRMEEAGAAFAASAEVRRGLWQRAPSNVSLGNMTGSAYRVWCRTLVGAGRFSQAVPVCDEGVRIQREVVAQAAGSPILIGNLGAVLAWHGRALRGVGRSEEAARVLGDAVRVLGSLEADMEGYSFEVPPDSVRTELAAIGG